MPKLILVVLPIGNVGDLTGRVSDFLRKHKTFLAEDTRHFAALLNYLGIDSKSKSIDSFHDYSQGKMIKIVSFMKKGESIAIVSNAGSPILSDPAYPLVREILGAGYGLEILPGVNSVTTALEVSGLPPHPFTFHGFLPRKDNELIRFFQKHQGGTHIVFESPRRIVNSIKILCREIPECEISVARELTKKFEEVVRFKADSTDWEERLTLKGEFVLLYHCKEKTPPKDSKVVELAEDILEKNSPKKLAQLLARILERDSKDIYRELFHR